MARPLRVIQPGGWYHITARGIDRRSIFQDRRDHLHFLELLEELTARFGLTLHAYALMGNHYHLFIQLGRPNLSRAIQWLNLSHSAWFNRRHQRSGYLFQGRFKSILVEPRAWAFRLSAYIHLNPARLASLRLGKTARQRARAGVGEIPDAALIERRLAALRRHPWTSYAAYIGTAPRPPWLNTDAILQLGGGPASKSAANYRAYVENQLREGAMQTPWEELRDQIILGPPRFVAKIKSLRRARGSPRQRWPRQAVDLRKVIAAVEKARGERWTQFKDRHADKGRDLVIFLARRATNLTTSELAQALDLRQHASVSMAAKRYEAYLHKNRAERRLAETAAQLLHVTL